MMAMETELKHVPDLFSLVESGNGEALQELLSSAEEGSVDLQARRKYRTNPLELASVLGKADVAAVLLEKGADVSSRGSSGYGAMHMAAAWGRLDCLRVLVGGGADHRQRTRHGETARDTAERYGQQECVDYLECVGESCGVFLYYCGVIQSQQCLFFYINVQKLV